MKTAKTAPSIDLDIFDTIGPVPGPLENPGLSLQGTAGNDLIQGSSLDDLIRGLAGNDRLYGEDGNDILDGGAGDDILIGGRGADTLIGGDGIDTASYTTAGAAVIADLRNDGWSGDAGRDIYIGVENLTGSNFDDILFGNNGDNRLDGGRGNDTLLAGDGNDVLIGGAGVDTLFGDRGADIFQVSLEGGGVYDRIMDFEQGIDKIRLAGFDNSAFGNDWHLASGDIHAEFPDGRWLRGGDKVFYDTASEILYKIDVQLIDGTFTIVHSDPIAQIHLSPLSQPLNSGDFIFA